MRAPPDQPPEAPHLHRAPQAPRFSDSKGMKVLHVIPAIAPRYGGPTAAVLGICRALCDTAGVAAEIATTDADGARSNMKLEGPNPHLYRGVPVWMFPRTFSEVWKYSRGLNVWLHRHASDYDLLHAHAVFSYSTTAACRAAARHGIPVVLTSHGMLTPYCRGQSWVRKLVYWHLLEKRNVLGARCLHAATPGEREELQRLLPRQRVECVYWGLEDEAWTIPKSPGAFRDRYGIPRDRPLVLFLARLHRVKNLAELLLPAMAQLPAEVMLAVVGDEDAHDPKYAQLARSLTAELGLNSRVVYTGFLYDREKWAAYDDADVYVLPSAHENFGITVIEAMARGLPSVVCPGVQAGPLLVEAQAGEVVQANVADLAGGIRRTLAMSNQQRALLACRGQEFTRRELSWTGAARKLAALYQASLLEKHG